MHKYAPDLGETHDAERKVLVLTRQGWVTYEIKHECGDVDAHPPRCDGCKALRGEKLECVA